MYTVYPLVISKNLTHCYSPFLSLLNSSIVQVARATWSASGLSCACKRSATLHWQRVEPLPDRFSGTQGCSIAVYYRITAVLRYWRFICIPAVYQIYNSCEKWHGLACWLSNRCLPTYSDQHRTQCTRQAAIANL